MNHYQQPDEVLHPPRPHAERLTEDEAQAVLALWAEKQKAQESVDAMPTAADVAETLGASVEQVEKMLQEVRSRGLLRAPRTKRAAVGRARRTVALVLGVYLLSPIPVGFTINHFANRDYGRVSALYAPLSWLHDNTALRAPLGLYGTLLEKL